MEEVERIARLADGGYTMSFESRSGQIRVGQLAQALIESQRALCDLLLFFESGNSVPVETAHIRADSEWVAQARAALLDTGTPSGRQDAN